MAPHHITEQRAEVGSGRTGRSRGAGHPARRTDRCCDQRGNDRRGFGHQGLGLARPPPERRHLGVQGPVARIGDHGEVDRAARQRGGRHPPPRLELKQSGRRDRRCGEVRPLLRGGRRQLAGGLLRHLLRVHVGRRRARDVPDLVCQGEALPFGGRVGVDREHWRLARRVQARRVDLATAQRHGHHQRADLFGDGRDRLDRAQGAGSA